MYDNSLYDLNKFTDNELLCNKSTLNENYVISYNKSMRLKLTLVDL